VDYLKLLEHSYEMERLEDADLDRAEYLSDHIFDFTTYDGEIANLFGQKAVDVCKAITDKATFNYIDDEESYKWYLLMINMPFFEKKLNWGTSIRGAWWDLHGNDIFELNSCGLYENEEQLLDIKFNELQWNAFVKAMAVFTEATAET